MKLLVVSSNPLFAEVIDAVLGKYQNYSIILTLPCDFSQALAKDEPDVILVDESLGSSVYEPFLIAARQKTSSHIVMLNSKDNSLCVLDSRRTIIQELDDLCQAISRGTGNQPLNDPFHVNDSGTHDAREIDPAKEVEQRHN